MRPISWRLLPAIVTAFLVACSGGPEQSTISQFFTASRFQDNTTLGSIATVAFDPGTQGTVTRFTIVSVSDEQRRPVSIKALTKAQDEARAKDVSFTKRKEEYQAANLDAIRRVISARGDNKTVAGKDADVQVAWTKVLEESAALSKKIAEARRSLRSERQMVDLSVNTGSTHVDISKYDGEVLTKEVTVSAPVRLPSTETASKTLVMTLQRAILDGDRGKITGRWIVTGFRDAGMKAKL